MIPNIKCPVCVEQGLTSEVHDQGTMQHMCFFQPYYDKEGIYHDHDHNKHATEYHCNRGHSWTKVWFKVCPSCGWQLNPDNIEIMKS